MEAPAELLAAGVAGCRYTGLVVPLDRPNVDTDAIIPKQYLKSIHRTGFGPNLFDDLRYLDPGEPGDDHTKRRLNPEFVLNLPRYRGAQILLTRENFGCGSSREHAVWSLQDYGIRAVIAPSFADIFAANAASNNLLLIVLNTSVVDHLFTAVAACEGYRLGVDVTTRQLSEPEGGTVHTFPLDENVQRRLLKGLDSIGEILQHADAIRAYERSRAMQTPWLFPDLVAGKPRGTTTR